MPGVADRVLDIIGEYPLLHLGRALDAVEAAFPGAHFSRDGFVTVPGVTAPIDVLQAYTREAFMAAPRKTAPLVRYHLVLADGTERDVRAASANITSNAALILEGSDDDLLVAYAPGAWTLCEAERKDDET